MSDTPTYYGRSAVKPSDWRWLIVSYFFVGGLAGAAQLIATIVDLRGHHRDRTLVSAGRYVALLGALASPVLLTADLKTPSRWYNMLRVFRHTSPMSIGSWTLLTFGTSSGLAALGQVGADVFGWRPARAVARLSGVPAALSGGLLAIYTGSLLSATSTPLWAVAYRWLPAMFGLSATVTASAALSLVLDRAGGAQLSKRRLERLALVATILELVVVRKVDAEWKRNHVHAALEDRPLRVAYNAGVMGLGIVMPLLVHLLQALTGRELRSASMVASVAALAGGFMQRTVVLMAGKHSAEQPQDYFANAQPYRVRDLTGAPV